VFVWLICRCLGDDEDDDGRATQDTDVNIHLHGFLA